MKYLLMVLLFLPVLKAHSSSCTFDGNKLTCRESEKTKPFSVDELCVNLAGEEVCATFGEPETLEPIQVDHAKIEVQPTDQTGLYARIKRLQPFIALRINDAEEVSYYQRRKDIEDLDLKAEKSKKASETSKRISEVFSVLNEAAGKTLKNYAEFQLKNFAIDWEGVFKLEESSYSAIIVPFYVQLDYKLNGKKDKMVSQHLVGSISLESPYTAPLVEFEYFDWVGNKSKASVKLSDKQLQNERQRIQEIAAPALQILLFENLKNLFKEAKQADNFNNPERVDNI